MRLIGVLPWNDADLLPAPKPSEHVIAQAPDTDWRGTALTCMTIVTGWLPAVPAASQIA
jgi:hypothetical protein